MLQDTLLHQSTLQLWAAVLLLDLLITSHMMRHLYGGLVVTHALLHCAFQDVALCCSRRRVRAAAAA